MIERLKRIGIWERAMVVVTADHGISFQGKAIYRRIAQKENLGGVANPPLFIKYPGQRRGKVSTVHTQTIDIVPTIARQLGITDAYKMRGRADLRGATARRVVAVTNAQGEVVRMPLSQMLSQRARRQRPGRLPARQRRPLRARSGSGAARAPGAAALVRDPDRVRGHPRARRRPRGGGSRGRGGPGLHRRRAGGARSRGA